MKFLMTSVASQLAQSMISLIATLVFARQLAPEEFGYLSAFWLAWMLLMSLLRSVYGEQVLVRGNSHESSLGYADFAILIMPLGLLVCYAIVALINKPSLYAGVLFIALFVLSDALRYVQLTDSASASGNSILLVADVLRSCIAILALILQWTASSSFLPIGLVCAAAVVWVLIGVARNGGVSIARAIRFARGSGEFEKNILTQFLLGTGLAQSVPYLALLGFGPASLGALRLGQSLLSPITLLTTALQPRMLVSLAGRKAAVSPRRYLVLLILVFCGLACALGAATVTLFDPVSNILVPSEYRTAVGGILMPLVILLSTSVVGQPGGAMIRVLRLGRISLAGQISGMVATVVLALIALQFTFLHFVWALCVGGIITVASSYFLLFVHLRNLDESGNS